MTYRIATIADCQTLAEWNHQLIPDEGHRNPMDIPQLKERMRGWLTTGGYTAVIFEENGAAVAYALYREDATEIYLRQFFVMRRSRRKGIGRRAVAILISQLWPKTKRLTVEVLTQNQTAVAFWRAMGYRDYSLALEIMPRP
jgi:GNAT superfamily N-acetyltransferase